MRNQIGKDTKGTREVEWRKKQTEKDQEEEATGGKKSIGVV